MHYRFDADLHHIRSIRNSKVLYYKDINYKYCVFTPNNDVYTTGQITFHPNTPFLGCSLIPPSLNVMMRLEYLPSSCCLFLKKKKIKNKKTIGWSGEGATTSCSKFPSSDKQRIRDCNGDIAAQPCADGWVLFQIVWSQHPSPLLVTRCDICTKIFNKHIIYPNETANLNVLSGYIPPATW